MGYHILIESVPTLSSYMLILLSLLLFIVAFKVSKNKGAKAGKMFITLIGVTALASGMGGVKLLSEANAVAVHYGLTSLPLNDSASTGHVDLISGLNEFGNGNTQTLIIDSITAPADHICGVQPNYVGTAPLLCTVGLNLSSHDHCHINCLTTDGDGGGDGENVAR